MSDWQFFLIMSWLVAIWLQPTYPLWSRGVVAGIVIAQAVVLLLR